MLFAKEQDGRLKFRNCLYLTGRDRKVVFLIFGLLAFVINYMFVWPFEVFEIREGPAKFCLHD